MVEGVGGRSVIDRAWQAARSYTVSSFQELKAMDKTRFGLQAVNLGALITTGLMIWMCLVVVVLSGSMEPAFYRGDILFLYKGAQPIRAGEVVVFDINGRDIPIVHRVIKVHEENEGGPIQILTKGDNNFADDYAGNLYAEGQRWLANKHIMGRVVGFLPRLGYATIVMNEQVGIKYGLIGILSWLVLTGKD